MLEIPESAIISRQITETLRGKTIEHVEAAQSPHGFGWYNGDPADYPAILNGHTVTGARAVAGQVEIALAEMRLLFNDGTNLRYLEANAKLPQKHQLYLRFTDGSGLVCTVQMYGGMMAFPEGCYDNFYYQVAQEKPNPLTEEFDTDYFERLWRETPDKLSAKALLATEQRIPGLGNGCAQDILFNARINPQSKLSALTARQMQALFNSIKQTLKAMVEGGGRNTEKDLFGQPGGYATLLFSKTWKDPCPACGGAIERKAFLGGNVYFCPTCQPVLK